MKQMYLKCFAVLCFSMMTIAAYAQKTVTGTVMEKSGQPIPGVSVMEKGTKNGTSTGADGKFSLSVQPGAILTFSSIGLATKEIAVGQSATVNVTLEEDANQLGEVVVTALGIKREKKSLGYAVQEVKGESLVEAKEPNLVNALSGKVAGLQISRSSNGPGASSRITLRGNNSLRNNANQPLIVVDGIPMDNFTGTNNNDFNNPGIDMGNGLADINPEDIESMSVLKGPSAAALYGSRAGNGAILITTKSGKAQNGLGITISSSVGIETPFTNPNRQSSFAQGTQGTFDALSTESWGPRIEGQSLPKWDGSSSALNSYDNVKNYFKTGLSLNQSVAIQQQFKSTSVYASYNRAEDKSMIPETELLRNNLSARTVTKLGTDERWTVDTKVQYNNTKANNRPITGARTENIFRSIYALPASMDIRDFSAATSATGKMLWFGTDNTVNPYWSRQYNLNEDERNRFLMNGSVKYQATDWLSAEIKGGADIYSVDYEEKVYAGSSIVGGGGRYTVGKRNFSETNFSTLLTAKKDNLFGKFGGVLTLGGNLMASDMTFIKQGTGEMDVPNFFSLKNGIITQQAEQEISRKRINSIYGSGQLSYDQYLFLDATFRNDWSSALSKINRSFFYPSVSASFVFSEMIGKVGGTLPSWMSFGKARASYAMVGNDLDPFQLYNTFSIGKDPNDHTTGSTKPVLVTPDIRSELIKSFELGLEMRFLNGRVGFDAAYYKSNATRQIIDIAMDPFSGYSSRKINTGDIQNEGFELMVDARILQQQDGFNWNLGLNFSRNNNTVPELYPGVPLYSLGGFDNLNIYAVGGGRYGDIYGTRYNRVKDTESEYFGQVILNENGLPTEDGERVRLGNQQANGLLGITNTFSYKGFGLSFLVDARFGGKIFSSTNALLQELGVAEKTAPNGMREDFVPKGVVSIGNGQYAPNEKAVSPQLYWKQVHSYGNLGVSEENIYDATNIRVRNVQLSYNLPKSILAKTPVQRAKVGFSVNNVWLISGDMNGIDPESIYATSSNATGFENGASPTARTFLFNLTVGF